MDLPCATERMRASLEGGAGDDTERQDIMFNFHGDRCCKHNRVPGGILPQVIPTDLTVMLTLSV
jgi:hypothetical protein